MSVGRNLIPQVLQINRHQFGQTALLHGYAEESIRDFHGFSAVSDHDDLALTSDFSKQIVKTVDIGFIQGRIHFIQQAERAWLDHINGKYEGHGHQSLFSPGQKSHVTETLPWGFYLYQHPAFKGFFFIGQFKAGPCPR